MKIAFCGASGTGKTTLAMWLAKKLEVPLNPVGSRSVAKSLGFNNPYDVDRACAETYHNSLEEGWSLEQAVKSSLDCGDSDHETLRTHFQIELLKQKTAWEREHDSFVTDRTPVDNFVYSALHNVHGVDEEYMRIAEGFLNAYDLVLFTPMRSFHDVADDANRVAGEDYHRIFELFCEGTLDLWMAADWNEKLRYVEKTLLHERMEEVMGHYRARYGFLNRFRVPPHQDRTEN